MARKKLTSWSFSRWNVYSECPYKAYLKFILKLNEPGSPALDRGAAVHKQLEDYLKDVKIDMPTDIVHEDLWQLMDTAKENVQFNGANAEATWAFRKDWSKTVYNDWDNCWLRVKVDYMYISKDEMDIIDWKTGKLREYSVEAYIDQLELYAVSGFKLYREVKKIYPRLAYVDSGELYPFQPMCIPRKDEAKLTKKWERRVIGMLSDQVYKPTPHNKCSFCHFRKLNGGPCQY